MDFHTDPVALRGGADRMGALTDDLERLADRLDRLAVDAPRSLPGGAADRLAALVGGLRSDAAELAMCEELLRQDRSVALAGEASVLTQMAGLDRRLGELSGRSS